MSYLSNRPEQSTTAEAALLTNLNDLSVSAAGEFIRKTSSTTFGNATPSEAGLGTVTSVSVVSANGVSGIVATATTTPAITLTLGDITPSSVQISGLTASEIVGTNASKTLVSLAVATYPSLTELTYVKGVTSAIQTQINTKAPSTAPTFATSITGSYLTASEILITDGSKNIVSAAVATYPSLTELTYVKGVTSAIQTQIDGKQASLGFTAENVANKSTDTSLGTSNTLYPSQNAVKTYVDNLFAGFSPKTGCRVATTANLTATYLNGVSGVGATLTNAGALAALSIDGVSVAANDRVLVKNQTNTFENGIYAVTTVGSGAVAWVLTRATDYDSDAEINESDYTVIAEGTANAETLWVMTTQGAITVGTTAIAWAELLVAAQAHNSLTGLQGGTTNEYYHLTSAEYTALSGLTVSEIVITDGSGNLASAAVATYPSLTELTYVKGVTSAIQTQLDTKITASSTDTLTNKTLTAPKFADLGFIADANGNEMVVFDTVASAVNEVTVVNAATGTAGPIIKASGETNTDLQLAAKGTGAVHVTTGSYGDITADTDGATVTFNLATSNVHGVTLGGNRTLAISNAHVGQIFTIRLAQDGTGSRTVTWFTTIKWAGGAAPTLTTTASKADTFVFLVTSAGNYDGYIVGANV